MRIINKITNQAQQSMILTGNPNQRITLDLRYMPTQLSWIADISYEDFTANGICITSSINILRAFHNILPFGIMVTTLDGNDPTGLDDFASGYAVMYLLTQAEVLSLEAGLFE